MSVIFTQKKIYGISYPILFLIEHYVTNKPMSSVQTKLMLHLDELDIEFHISSLNNFKSSFETLFLEQAIP